MDKLIEFQNKIGYNFKDISLLRLALTHSSYSNEKHDGKGCNERLEFLGDSVLGLVSAEFFFTKSLPEGEMTKRRASCVCEKALYEFSKKIDLGNTIFLGKGEEKSGGRKRKSIVSDAFEAVIAAIYLDGGLDEARRFIVPFLENAAKYVSDFIDYKTELQEVVQKNPDEHLTYVLVAESGPDHDKTFEVELHLNSNIIGTGKGHSKRAAEQDAAKAALELMGISL